MSESEAVENPLDSQENLEVTEKIEGGKTDSIAPKDGQNAKSIKVHSMGQLKETLPEFYEGMIKTIMTMMMSQQRRHNERLRKIIRESRNR